MKEQLQHYAARAQWAEENARQAREELVREAWLRIAGAYHEMARGEIPTLKVDSPQDTSV